jgi:coenzyme F420 hydrogenase subunit beta
VSALKNVAEVDARGLCLECGTCVGLCPRDNIRQEQDAAFRYRIRVIDADRCDSCSGICLKVCPGHTIDVDSLNRQVFDRAPEDYLAGNYLAAFFGYATDATIRERASSGGIVSALLIHALESRRISGAFLVRTLPGKPFSPEFPLATDAEGVLTAAGSKYWPAPVGFRLGDILHQEGGFAFVGTPCQIQGLRKAAGVYKRLNESIALCIGVFCGRRATAVGQVFLLRKLGIRLEDVSEMTYRQGEWPGHLVIRLRDGTRVDVPREKQLPGFSGHLFPHPRCVLCHDSISELADISVGDALRLERERSENEFSLVVARTDAGMAVLRSAEEAGVLHLRATNIGAVIHSQRRPLTDKRRAVWARIRLAQMIPGMAAPDIRLSRPTQFDPKLKDWIRGLTILVEAGLARRPAFAALLAHVPLRWLRRYETFERMSETR